MSEKLSGGCLCGAVRFELEVESPLSMHCYCKDCQRATGSAFATIFAVPQPQFQISGPLGSHAKAGDSGRQVERFFCKECGSPIYSTAEAMPGAAFVKAGVLDDASKVAPQMMIWTASRAPWAHLSGELQSFDKNPEM